MHKNQKSPFFRTMRVLILISGILTILISIIAMITKLNDGDAQKILVLVAMILGALAGIFEIIAGVTSFSTGKRAAVLGKGSNYSKVALVLCVIGLVVALVNGIMDWQLCSLFITGIVIPILYMFSARKSKANKQMRGRVNAARR